MADQVIWIYTNQRTTGSGDILDCLLLLGAAFGLDDERGRNP
jgi:hypothetical protein